jgi:hypothetical protein
LVWPHGAAQPDWSSPAHCCLCCTVGRHKELRFLLPVAPLLCALAAVGLDVVRDHTNARVARFAPHVLVILALSSRLHAGRLTVGDLRAYGAGKA